MALKKCKECGQQVSSTAKVCPHCGFYLKKWSRFIFWVALIGVLCMVADNLLKGCAHVTEDVLKEVEQEVEQERERIEQEIELEQRRLRGW
tara:strand:- start:318 stop:590 length:273 start_codon:yes stop_codon:yes gene_type:complete